MKNRDINSILNDKALNDAFEKVWGVDIEEGYGHITEVFEYLNNAKDSIYQLLVMLNQAIDNSLEWDESLSTFNEYTATIRGVKTLIYYAFYNEDKWENRYPYVEKEALKLEYDSPEYHIDRIFSDIVQRTSQEDWNNSFNLLLANHICPDRSRQIDRKVVASMCWHVNSMNDFLHTLETKALPLIQSYNLDEEVQGPENSKLVA